MDHCHPNLVLSFHSLLYVPRSSERPRIQAPSSLLGHLDCFRCAYAQITGVIRHRSNNFATFRESETDTSLVTCINPPRLSRIARETDFDPPSRKHSRADMGLLTCRSGRKIPQTHCPEVLDFKKGSTAGTWQRWDLFSFFGAERCD